MVLVFRFQTVVVSLGIQSSEGPSLVPPLRSLRSARIPAACSLPLPAGNWLLQTLTHPQREDPASLLWDFAPPPASPKSQADWSGTRYLRFPPLHPPPQAQRLYSSVRLTGSTSTSPSVSQSHPASLTSGFYPPLCLPFGGPSVLVRPLGALSLVSGNPQDPPHLCHEWPSRVEDAKKERKYRAKEERRGKKKTNLAYMHALKTNFGVGLLLFQTTRLDGWSIRRRFFEDV